MLDGLPQLGAAAWALLALGALVVGFSKTALPGSSTVAIGLFALALPAKESTAALLLLLIVGDAAALWVYRREPDIPTLLRLLPSATAGVAIGALYFSRTSGGSVRITIGVILLALAAMTILRRLPRRRRARDAPEARPSSAATADGPAGDGRPRWLRTVQGVAYGLLGGFTTMVANAGGPVMSLYLLAMQMPVRAFLGTSAWFFAIMNLVKLPFSAGLGLITPSTLEMAVVLVPLVLIGAFVGARSARRFSQRVFDNLVLALTVVAAAGLLL